MKKLRIIIIVSIAILAALFIFSGIALSNFFKFPISTEVSFPIDI